VNQVANRTQAGAIMAQSKLFEALPEEWDDLTSGVSVGFPIIGIKASRWHYRYKGEDQLFMDHTGRHPAAAIAVIILKAQKELSRTFYPDGYVEGANNPPSCWSSNGVAPDQTVQNPVNPVCATCPNAAWGSGATPAAPKAQACQQRRRTVVVPYGEDLTNEDGGGPCLLSVPPGSLTNFLSYGNKLREGRVHYAGVITELSFSQDPSIAFPKVEFNYVGSLGDEEAAKIIDLRNHEQVDRILNTAMVPAEVEATPETAATKAPPAPAPVASARAPVAQPRAAAAPQPAPQAARTSAPAPKPSAVRPPAQTAQPPKPPVAQVTQQTGQPRVGGFAATTRAPAATVAPAANGAGSAIASAVSKPATPPVSNRVVQATNRHMAAAPTDNEAEEHQGEPEPAEVEGLVPDVLSSQFDDLMSAE
jgi:hypothetical protein